jgi:hypothetical protein
MSKTLIELCKEIASAPALQNVACDLSAGLAAEKINDLEEEYSITISPVVRKFLSELDSFKLAWEFHNNELRASNTYIEGSSRILNFHKMFMGFDGRFWLDELWFDNTPPADLQFLKHLKVLDYYGKDSVQCVCIEITSDDVLSPKLWLFYQGFKPLRMEFDVSQYLHKLRQTKAIWGWQFFYVDINLSDKRYEAIKENCELVITWYGKIFSDGFDSELRDRYRKLLGAKS